MPKREENEVKRLERMLSKRKGKVDDAKAKLSAAKKRAAA